MSSFEVIEGWEGRRGKGRGGGLDSREFLRKRSELFRPRSERRSCGRLICLAWMELRFLFALRAKNREWLDSYSGFLVTFGSPWLHWFHSDKNNLTCRCFSYMEWTNLLTLCVSCIVTNEDDLRMAGKKQSLFSSQVDTWKGDLQWPFFKEYFVP